MSNPQSIALASLTATYTDSENEDEPVENNTVNDSSPASKATESLTPPLPKPTVEVGGSQSVARLVSYNDDLVQSDDENDIVDIERQSGNESLNSLDDVQLPPEPNGRCSMELQEKIARLHERMLASGLDMNSVIQRRKDFRNPSIYEKLIQFCSINEFGTNYAPQVYDPSRWGKESYYEELAKVQKAEMDRREKERKEKTKVEFVVGTAKRNASTNVVTGTDEDAKRRKSKWDQVGIATSAQTIVRPPGLVQQSTLTTTATGTKGTVISAFGSLPKKPRF